MQQWCDTVGGGGGGLMYTPEKTQKRGEELFLAKSYAMGWTSWADRLPGFGTSRHKPQTVWETI